MTPRQPHPIMNLLPGIITLLVVLGLAYYFCFVMVSIKNEPLTLTPKESYPITTVENEMKTGVFSKLPPVESKTGGAETKPEVIKYQDGELGKTDLTKFD